MPGFGDIVQKAIYLGVGLAAYAGEKAGSRLAELRSQAQKLADEMVERGEMTTDEARRFVEDMMNQAQKSSVADDKATDETSSEPRHIEILEDGEDKARNFDATQSSTSNSTNRNSESNKNVDNLRQQVLDLQEELKRLQRDK
ncbi:MAG: phasin family protein [Mastigocoleus sp.]